MCKDITYITHITFSNMGINRAHGPMILTFSAAAIIHVYQWLLLHRRAADRAVRPIHPLLMNVVYMEGLNERVVLISPLISTRKKIAKMSLLSVLSTDLTKNIEFA